MNTEIGKLALDIVAYRSPGMFALDFDGELTFCGQELHSNDCEGIGKGEMIDVLEGIKEQADSMIQSIKRAPEKGWQSALDGERFLEQAHDEIAEAVETMQWHLDERYIECLSLEEPDGVAFEIDEERYNLGSATRAVGQKMTQERAWGEVQDAAKVLDKHYHSGFLISLWTDERDEIRYRCEGDMEDAA